MSQFGAASHPPLLTLACCSAAIALLVSFSVDADAVSNTSPAVEAQKNSFVPSDISFAATAVQHEPPTLAPSAIVLEGLPAYRVGQGKVTFFFAASSAELRQTASQALQDIASSWKQGQRLALSGFHDLTGNAQQNIVLAKKRALAVQKQLVSLGIPASHIVLNKPAAAAETEDLAEARRVEVVVLR